MLLPDERICDDRQKPFAHEANSLVPASIRISRNGGSCLTGSSFGGALLCPTSQSSLPKGEKHCMVNAGNMYVIPTTNQIIEFCLL